MTQQSRDITFRWVAGALLSIVTIMGAAWASNINTRLERVETALERIARLEVSVDDMRDMLRELIRITPPGG